MLDQREAGGRQTTGPGSSTAPSRSTGSGPSQGTGPSTAPSPQGPHPSRDAAPPTHTLRYVARSDRGLIRATNQDSVFAGNRLLVIADGMGGHAAGDTASRLVVAAFAPLNDRAPAADLLSDLVASTREGNEAIAEVVADNPELDGMGTTVTAMLFDGDRVGMAHVGDSRAYLYRSGVLHQLTHDDTFVQSLVDDGRITEDEAAHHPQRNLLLRALNGTDLDPFLALREVRAGDRYLLCSDGLSGVVGAEPIADTLADPDPERAADVLIQRALLRGGPDNVTVIVADVVDTGVSPVPGPVMVPAAADDPDATGPIQQLTREMPRVPLPPIPEEPGAPAELVDEDGNYDDGDEDDQDGGDEDRDDSAPDGDGDGAVLAAGTRRAPRRSSRKPWQRRGALTVAIVALVLVALAGSTLWVRSQYYVGAQNNLVAVFRGVNGSLLGFHFSSFQETSCANRTSCTPIRVTDLQQGARNQVLAGIPATSLTDARGVMDRLSGELLPPCPETAGGSGSGAPESSTAGSSAAGSPGAGGSDTPGATEGTLDSATGPTTSARHTGPSGRQTTSPATGTAAPTSRSAKTGTTATSGRTAKGKAGKTSKAAKTGTTAKARHRGTRTATSLRSTPTGVDAAHRTSGAYAERTAADAASGRVTGTSTAGATAATARAGGGVVTLEPPPTTLTVQVTVTPPPNGLVAAIQRALHPAVDAVTPGTRTPGTRSTDPTRTVHTTTTRQTTDHDTAGGAPPTGNAPPTSTAPVSTVTAGTPTVTVTHTVTAGSSTSGTPLAPAAPVPGVSCRVVG